MGFTGKVVLITGASSGIGAATALHLAKLGAKLALTGRNQDQLTQVSKSCLSVSPNQPLLINVDLTVEKDTEAMVDKIINHYQKLDVLVNNAGIIELGSIESTSMEQYDKIMAVNVRTVYHLTMLAVPHLIKTKVLWTREHLESFSVIFMKIGPLLRVMGNIVNISSVNGLRSFPGVLAYCMSKSAIDQFTSCTALELASKGVRVNSVNPGVILTNLQKRGGLDEETYQKFLERSKETHALGRVGNPEEVAKAIAFLASDDASFTTGEHLTVDGGRHAMCPR